MKHLVIVFSFLILLSCNNKSNNSKVNISTYEPTLEKATVVSYQNVNVADFDKAISEDDVIVIDVRTPEETAEGTVDRALELNFYDKDFSERLLALDKSKSYYVYCKAGGRSAKTARLMVKNGFSKVFNLEGGYTEWSATKK